MARTIDDLRDLLFDAAERLANAKSGEALDAEILRARGIGELGKVIVDTAKVEVAREHATGQVSGSGFLPSLASLPEGRPATPRLVEKVG